MSNINIRDIAKELNLSISTVSKALKDSYEISAATKQRVIDLAKNLNYTPNPYASSLRKKKSHTIAVVVPEVADSFFSLAIKGIEEIAQMAGYHVLIYLTYESYVKEKKILEEFRNGRVDGVLISISSETTNTTHIIRLKYVRSAYCFF
jgi:LacI family transcriptional regulator